MLDPKYRLGRRVYDALPANVTVRPATKDDCISLAPRLRKEDREEAEAVIGLPASYAMMAGLRDDTLVACVNGTPEMIFGCPGADIVGTPWMLASPLPFTPQWSRVFLRASKEIVTDDWQARYPLLTNFTDARNVRHHRWLRWLGFQFIRRDETYGVAGIPFLEFVRIQTPCA